MTSKDRRTKVANPTDFPWSAHGLMEMKFGPDTIYRGSGTLVKPGFVITAAHNVWDRPTQKSPISVTFSPGYSGGIHYNLQYAQKTFFHPDYVRKDKEAIDYDMALLQITPSAELPFFPIRIFNSELQKYEMHVTGYPGESGKDQDMYTMSGKIVIITPFRIYYDIDTTAGQSGSGIYFRNGDSYCCVGVHTHGALVHPYYNSGTYITEEKWDSLQEWAEGN